MKVRSVILAIAMCLLLASANVLLAQTGTIKGIVIAEKTQLPIQYTNVMIVGEKLGNVTLSDGSFVIGSVPVGTYTVKAMAMGYQSLGKDSVIVKENQITHLSFQLSVFQKYRRKMNILYEDVEIEQNNEGNFVLYVKNKSPSIDPIDIKVYLDGKLAIHGDFYKGNDPKWGKFLFMLTKGKHKIQIKSKRGDTISEHEFEMVSKLWAGIEFIYNAELNYQRKQFFFGVSNSACAFH